MSKDNLMLSLVTVGILLIAVAIVLPFFTGPTDSLFKYIYAVGALMLICGRAFSQYKGNNLRIKRLFRIELWGAMFFCVAAFFLFYPPGNNLRDVLAFTLAGGAIQVFTSIMIPMQVKKEEAANEEKETKKKK